MSKTLKYALYKLCRANLITFKQLLKMMEEE